MRKLFENLKTYPTKVITVILGLGTSLTAIYYLLPGSSITRASTLSFDLGGTDFYMTYLVACLIIGLLAVISVSFGIHWLEKQALLGLFAIRTYICIVTIMSVGFFPLTWLTHLALALTALSIRLSLRLKDDDESLDNLGAGD